MNKNDELDVILFGTKQKENKIINKKIDVSKYAKLEDFEYVEHKNLHIMINKGDIIRYSNFDMTDISNSYIIKNITTYNDNETQKFVSKIKYYTLWDVHTDNIFRLNPRKHYIFFKMSGQHKNKVILKNI
jgi:hypothetical protein